MVSSGTGSARIGRYEVIKAIASGGMATVYLGRVVGAGGFERLVAIKSMHPHIGEDPEFVAMFLDEARLAARVRHPNVVPTIDVQEEPLFLVMEYIEGPSLHAVLRALRKKGEPLPIGIALRVIIDVLNGLHAAHELKGANGHFMQIVHRDVSPQNMLIGIDGISRITDFGVARAESRLSSTRGGQVKGKIGYMAPEQVRSEPADRRSDTYAAAVVLWELLAGKPLFMADNEGALVAQVAMGTERSPRELAPSVPEAIEAATMHALATEPAERFASAAEMADALEAAAQACGVVVAHARVVSAFVRDLGAHESPDAPARPSSRPLPAWSVASADVKVDAPASRDGGSLGAGSTSAVLAPATDDVLPPSTTMWRVPAIVGALAVVTLGIGYSALRGGSEATSAAPGPASESPVIAPPSASSAAPEAAEAASTPPSSPSGVASAAPSATPPSSAPTPSASVAPLVAPPTPNPGAQRPATPPGKPTSFRPNGL